jgi:hypothetical protein
MPNAQAGSRISILFLYARPRQRPYAFLTLCPYL